MNLSFLLLYSAVLLTVRSEVLDYESESDYFSLNRESEETTEQQFSVCDFGWQALAKKDDNNFKWCIRSLDYYQNDWDYADNICVHMGGHLVSFDDVESFQIMEENVLNALHDSYTFKQSQHSSHFAMWVGLGQMCPKHTAEKGKLPILRWTDGRKFDPNEEQNILGVELKKSEEETNWDQRYCVLAHLDLKKKEGATSYFNLTTCDQHKPFICMKSALKAKKPKADGAFFPAYDPASADKVFLGKYHDEEMTAEHPCGPDPSWCPLKNKEGGFSCYRVIHKSDHWQTSDETCQKHKGTLASVHESHQKAFLGQLASFGVRALGEEKYKYWIGLNQNNAERSLTWSDGTALDYLVESSDQLDEKEMRENADGKCFALRLVYNSEEKKSYNTWVRQRCDNRLMGICQKKGFGHKGKKSQVSRKELAKRMNTKCPEGWHLFNSMCYRVFGTEADKQLTFDEAKKACPNEAQLVSITTTYEQAFVLWLLSGLKMDAWIGMEILDGKMMWLDQEPLSFSKFAPSSRMIKVNPDKYLLQNDKTMGFTQDACVSMDGTDMFGYWDTTFARDSNVRAIFGTLMSRALTKEPSLNDTCSKKKLPYICEQFAEPGDDSETATEKELPLGAQCENFVATDTTFCFLKSTIDFEKPMTYDDAKRQCASLTEDEAFREFTQGGNRRSQLAVVDDIFEWSFLMSHSLHHGMESFWMGYEFSEEYGFRRIDGGRINIGPWGVGEPNTHKGSCVQMTLGSNQVGATWEMRNCTAERPVVCRFADAQPKIIETTRKCPKGKETWILGKERCYLLETNQSMITTGYKAEHDCFRYHNASLASFPTREDFQAFVNYAHTHPFAVGSAFIGLVSQSGVYGYTDHTPVSFVHWAEGEPTPSMGRVTSQDCVQLELSGKFEWSNENCWTSKHYVCSVPNELVQSPPQDVDTSGRRSDEPSDPKDKKDDETIPNLPDENADDSTIDKHDHPDTNSVHTEESSNWVTVVLLLLMALVIGCIVAIYRVRRKRLAFRMREHQIMQFDTLQNEDDDGL